ncbi:DNA helicase-2 / ATP-dependent DNA helicase PcrA [Clostridium amylolyticum]|uniref:DNA 3'-5' helicase n=1 Tax=Clostridium amylolyticum TaxID=1121298 RepID=A0A1M6MND9_9CLOT|nr:RNA polymerase recycling motor HelD [Clostridium amylolyticum]SHJ85025.1 DNA helicase-2 / ATP-dependent DNA helicase PcrA [Clostridium amylolyticum]
MNSKEKQLKEEREHLIFVRTWVKDKIEILKDHRGKLETKLKELKKASRGSYSEELETIKGIYSIADKNYNNYNESIAQPYFARIDFREYKSIQESIYIGKFSLGDENTGDEIVIDWRAPIADLYYSGTQGESYYKAPSGIVSGELSLKRKFLYKDDNILDIFDEGLNEIIIKSASGEEALVDEFLKINLEASTGKKLKDVVATIQKEQNEIIRAEKNIPIIVQGAAGSGKTTVALHRLAYLLYRYRNTLQGKDIMVVAPNMIFLDYISDLLPSLGVENVKQCTFETLAKEVLGIKLKVYSKDKKLSWILENGQSEEYKFVVNASKVKGSLTYKTMMDRLIKIVERTSGFNEDMISQNTVLFEGKEIKRLFFKDLSHLSLKKRKEEIKRYLTAKLDNRIKEIQEKTDFQYEYSIARTKRIMEDGVERRKKLIDLYNERDKSKATLKENIIKDFNDYFFKWDNIDVIDLYNRFYNEEEVFNEVTAGKIPKALADYMKKTFNDNLQSGIIDSEDLCALLYLQIVFQGINDKDKFSHIVIDEAQDYSFFELFLLKYFTNLNSLTIVGDIGQGIYSYKGINSWNKVIKDIFQGNATYMPLTQSYRSTIEIIDLANKVLLKQENEIEPAIPVLRHGKKPEVIKFVSYKNMAEVIDSIVDNIHTSEKNSVAIICKTKKDCKQLKDNLSKYSKYTWETIGDNHKDINMNNMIIPCYMTKGLEFDATIIYDCSDKNYTLNEEDIKLLYVALTRALHEEYIIYKDTPSVLIKDFE